MTPLERAERSIFVYWFLCFFLLFISRVEYINMKYISHCNFEIPENITQYNDPSSNYNCAMTDFVVDSFLNFSPNVHNNEITEHGYILDLPKLVEPKILTSVDPIDKETSNICNMIIKFKQMENTDKVVKCFRYAMAQNPHHHDVLLHYGEFLESRGDFINADHFYFKALMLKPNSSRILDNRRRTLPVVYQLDHEELERIDLKRFELFQLSKNHPIPKRLKKEIYIQYIHHTVALEGNTMTLSETQKIVETKLPVDGKSMQEYNEILAVEDALHYVYKTFANDDRDIHMTDFLEIHKKVLERVDSLAAGTFRKIQVYVGNHQPPPPSDVEELMKEFARALGSSSIKNMHPVYIAAFIHYNLVCIHPFLDGNGRTARLLMNLITYRFGYPPIIIRKGEKNKYHKLLQTANEGDHRPFYRFIARITEYTIDALIRAHKSGQLDLKVLDSSCDITDVIPLGY